MTPFATKHLRVFLVDDHDIVRRGLVDLMSAKRDIMVVGDSESAARAPEQILALEPDVMVLDAHLQDGTGVEVCRRVRATAPSIRALLLTAAEDDEALVLALLAGASGYAIKLARSIEIVDAVRRVGGGEQLIDDDARDRAADILVDGMRQAGDPLSPHDEVVLAHMIAGRTDVEVAELTGIETARAVVDGETLVGRVLRARPWSARDDVIRDSGRHRGGG